jgi:hypothetical protein
MTSYDFIVHWFLVSSFLASDVLAWSSECHSIIAYIGGSLLDENESSYLQKLMQWETGSTVLVADQLEGIAMEADLSLYDKYKYYHYAHALPSFATPWEKATMCGHSQNPTVCVVTGIAMWTAKAASISRSISDRQFAIKMVTHLMGDIHQPLHIGLWKDLGGLKVEKVWKSYNPYREFKHYNLHELWDRGLFRHYEVKGIEAGLISPRVDDVFIDSDDESEESEPGWKVLASELLSSLNITTIASHKIADPDRDTRDLSRSSQAMRLPKKIATETIQNVRDFAYTDEKGKLIKSGVEVSEMYINSRVEVMKLILTRAGVRLADLLKHIIQFSIAAEEADKLAEALDAVNMDSQTSETTVGEPQEVQFDEKNID